MTTDFAMQNVMLQVGLRLLSVDGSVVFAAIAATVMTDEHKPRFKKRTRNNGGYVERVLSDVCSARNAQHSLHVTFAFSCSRFVCFSLTNRQSPTAASKQRDESKRKN